MCQEAQAEKTEPIATAQENQEDPKIIITVNNRQEGKRDDRLMALVRESSDVKIDLDYPEKTLQKLGRRRFWSGVETTFHSIIYGTTIVTGAVIALNSSTEESWKFGAGVIVGSVGAYHFVMAHHNAGERNYLTDSIRQKASNIIIQGAATYLKNHNPFGE